MSHGGLERPALRQAKDSRPVEIIDVPPDRYPECLAVLRGGFATEVADFGITRENTPSNPAFWDPGEIDRVVARGFSLFAVVDATGIRGCAFAGASRTRPRVWGLRHLAVEPAARHLGYGASLVAEASHRARAAGAHVLAIGIVGENTRLGDWYRGMGFITTDSVSYPGLVFTVEHLELELWQSARP